MSKFKARWKKNEQNYNALLSFMYSLCVFISFSYQFWQNYNNYRYKENAFFVTITNILYINNGYNRVPGHCLFYIQVCRVLVSIYFSRNLFESFVKFLQTVPQFAMIYKNFLKIYPKTLKIFLKFFSRNSEKIIENFIQILKNIVENVRNFWRNFVCFQKNTSNILSLKILIAIFKKI